MKKILMFFMILGAIDVLAKKIEPDDVDFTGRVAITNGTNITTTSFKLGTNNPVTDRILLDTTANIGVTQNNFTNTIGGNSFTNTGFSLQAGSGMEVSVSGAIATMNVTSLPPNWAYVSNNATKILTSNISYWVTTTTPSTGLVAWLTSNIPYNLGGKIATLNFEKGTNIWTNTFSLSGYYNGEIRLYGTNIASGGTYISQGSCIGLSNQASLSFDGCGAKIVVRDLKIEQYNLSSNQVAFNGANNCYMDIQECYFISSSATYGLGVGLTTFSRANVHCNVFDNHFSAINTTYTANINAMSNIWTGTINGIGYSATQCGIIQRQDDMTLGTTNNNVSSGGLVVRSTGSIL